ncbi:hypothetical protein Tco_0855709 [Tanacetum coccineum]
MGGGVVFTKPSGLAQMAINGNLREVVTTCGRSQVRASPWRFSFSSEKRIFPTTALFDYANTLILTDDNIAEWKENVLMTLGCMDMDLALHKDAPPKPTESSTQIVKSKYEQWARSDRLSIMFIRSRISPSIRGVIPTCT